MANFQIVAFISGRQGSQTENFPNKRMALRQAKKLIEPHPFGSAVHVTMQDNGKNTLIFQAHVAKRRDGSLYVRSDEL
jgi:hypothetical protein